MYENQFETLTPYIRSARLQSYQSTVAFIGDGDNSLSMRWVKLDLYACMIHAAGAGGGWQTAAFGSVGCVKEDRQPDISSGKAIAQAILVTLGISHFPEASLLASRQPLPKLPTTSPSTPINRHGTVTPTPHGPDPKVLTDQPTRSTHR